MAREPGAKQPRSCSLDRGCSHNPTFTSPSIFSPGTSDARGTQEQQRVHITQPPQLTHLHSLCRCQELRQQPRRLLQTWR